MLSEIYAKLIALLIQHKVMLVAGHRHIRQSFIKTAEHIAGYARQLTVSFHQSKTALCETLKIIKRVFKNDDDFQRPTGKNTTFWKLKDATKNP